MNKLNLKTEISNFLKYLTVEKGCSATTVKNYTGHLNNMVDFMKNKEFNPNSIREYRNYLAEKKLSKGSQNAYLIALRSFVKYLARTGIVILPLENVELIKTGERQIKVLTSAQMEQLLNKPKIKTLQGLRDKAILEVLFATGLRVSELCSLNRTDIDFKTDEFSVLGKGGRVRPIFLSLRASDWLKQYLIKRKDKDVALFVKTRKKYINGSLRLGTRTVQSLVKRYAQQVGLPEKITPHVLRHLFACDLLSNGADLRSIQELLGHKNLATTQIYTHVTNPQLKETYLKFHGREL